MPDDKEELELREKALLLANNHHEQPEQVADRAQRYLAFLKGERQQ